MKKVFIYLIAVFVSASAYAATPTNTPTPSYTPTNTPTVTPTFTPTPYAIYNPRYVRNYAQPKEFLQDDGITSLGASVVTGPTAYLLQKVSQTAAALGTNTAKVRINWTVPADFAKFNSRGMGYLQPYLVCLHSTTNTAVPIVVDITRSGFNTLTYTTTDTQTYSGTYQTITARTSQALVNNTWSRVPLILPPGLTQTAIVAGDQLSMTIERQTTVATGILQVLRVEWEYQNVDYLKP